MVFVWQPLTEDILFHLGGDIIDFFWAPNEPNDEGGGEDCINLIPINDGNYFWNDEDCSKTEILGKHLYFICQFGKFIFLCVKIFLLFTLAQY